MNNDDLAQRYPIGKFAAKDAYTLEDVEANINRIAQLPAKLEQLVSGFSDTQFDTPYRQGGWTVRQVLHHVADSHMNAYIRFKWTLTEDTPTIKAYDEKAWAETNETKQNPGLSVNLLKALHLKLVVLLKGLKPDDLKREFIHPETKSNVSLARLIALYAWHGEHHLGHVQLVASKK